MWKWKLREATRVVENFIQDHYPFCIPLGILWTFGPGFFIYLFLVIDEVFNEKNRR